MFKCGLSDTLLAMLVVGLMLVGCASVSVDRMAVEETADLSGRLE